MKPSKTLKSNDDDLNNVDSSSKLPKKTVISFPGAMILYLAAIVGQSWLGLASFFATDAHSFWSYSFIAVLATVAYSYLNIYFLWFTFSVTKFETYAENACFFKGVTFMYFVCAVITFAMQM